MRFCIIQNFYKFERNLLPPVAPMRKFLHPADSKPYCNLQKLLSFVMNIAVLSIMTICNDYVLTICSLMTKFPKSLMTKFPNFLYGTLEPRGGGAESALEGMRARPQEMEHKTFFGLKCNIIVYKVEKYHKISSSTIVLIDDFVCPERNPLPPVAYRVNECVHVTKS